MKVCVCTAPSPQPSPPSTVEREPEYSLSHLWERVGVRVVAHHEFVALISDL